MTQERRQGTGVPPNGLTPLDHEVRYGNNAGEVAGAPHPWVTLRNVAGFVGTVVRAVPPEVYLVAAGGGWEGHGLREGPHGLYGPGGCIPRTG